MNYTGYDPRDLGLTVRHSAGINEVLCACPWHGGSDSLCVNLQTGKFICYSCGERGGVDKLVRQTGGSISWTTYQRPSPAEQEREWQKLLEGDFAYDDPYLIGRGVTNDQVEKFQIRRVWNGVAFPLFGRSGEHVGALIRRREGKIRYITLGEKPAIWPFTALDQLPPGHGLIVTEGVFGVLSADRANLPAVAVLGAAVKKEVRSWLQPYHLAVMFDRDLAGYMGAFKLMHLCAQVKTMDRPLEADSLDPDEWYELFEPGRYVWVDTKMGVMQAACKELKLTHGEFAHRLGPAWFSRAGWEKYRRMSSS